nr:alkaline phosphatase PhoX [Sphingobium nicotianae]
MKNLRTLALCAGCVVLSGLSATSAQATIDFTPLPSSATVGSLSADQPFLLPSGWTQQTLFTNQENGLWRAGANRNGNSNFDMIVQNETGPNAGRYLFTVNESTGGGLVRYDRVTDTPVQLLEGSLNGTSYRSLDPVRWTPWGTIVIGEEVSNGRLIEITNPLAAPGSIVAIDRPNIGRTSWEGLAWDAQGNAYYQDEDNNGGIYKFVPSNSAADYDPNDPSTSPLAGKGQIFALRINSGNTEQREGVAEWVALNNPDGTPIPGITDPTVNARQAADQVSATNYRRPEDMHLVIRDGKEYLVVAATTADNGTSPGRHHVYSIDLSNPNAPQVRSFVDDYVTIDQATGLPVDASSNIFANPDNIAFDQFGDMWIVEDNEPGDIWKTTWSGNPGVAATIARFASLASPGAEPTGLYFDINNPYIAYVNVQHPSDGVDRMIQFTFTPQVPEPATWAMMIGGLAMVGGTLRRRRRVNISFA